MFLAISEVLAISYSKEVPAPDAPDSIARIVDISARTDSVSVAVQLTLTPDSKNVAVLWDDGSQTNRTLPLGFSSMQAFPPGPALPPGVIEFVHVYDIDVDEPGYRSSGEFTRQITAIVSDVSAEIDVRTIDVTIQPRLNVEIFPVSLRQLSPCDFFGAENNFKLTLKRNDVTIKKESRTITSNFFPTPYQVIDDSAFVTEITPADGEFAASQRLVVVETDAAVNEVGSVWISHTYVGEQGETETVFELGDGWFSRCRMEVKYFSRVRPVVPFSENPPLVVTNG